MSGLPAMGSSSLGTTLVAGRNRVPNPAAGMTSLRILEVEVIPSCGLRAWWSSRARLALAKPGTGTPKTVKHGRRDVFPNVLIDDHRSISHGERLKPTF